MNFSEIFIKNPIMTTLIMVAVFVFGAVSFFALPLSDLPVVDFPVMKIDVGYPGASPTTMATTVASPIENECMQIQGLKYMVSNNTEGDTEIILTFELDRSIDLAAPDVQAAITRAQANLPVDLPSPPVYSKSNPTDTPIIYLVLTSDTLTPGELYDYGNRTVGNRIAIIEGVSQVQVWGAKSAVRIQVSPDKLSAYQIGINEIAQALDSGTVTIPGGSLQGTVRTFSVEPMGQLLRAKEYDELIVAYRNNSPVRLKDVATCVDSLQLDAVNVLYQGSGDVQGGSVVVGISRATGSNTIKLSQKIKDTVAELSKEMPGSVKLEFLYDASESIIESVNDVKTTILIALFLVVLVIFLFLGSISDTIIPAIALPISVVASFGVMSMAGFSLDTLSLMGITLAIGFVVDDAIVVLENTVRLIERGGKPLNSAVKSSQEITGTVLSMTLALVTVFVPLVFMGGVVGRLFREFALTVIYTIVCSGIVSLTLTPMMCARMLKETGASAKTKLQNFMDHFMDVMREKYGVALKYVLHHRFIAVVMWVFCLVGTFLVFSILPKTFIPEGDSGSVFGQMVAPLGISTPRMQQFQNQMTQILHEDPYVQKTISVTGLQLGADQSTGPVFAILKPRKDRPVIQKVVQELRKKMAVLTEGAVYLMANPALKISTGGDSTAAGSKYSYNMVGADRDKLYDTAFKLEQKLKTMPEFVDVQNSIKLSLPQLSIEMLRDRASSLGITAQDIEYAMELCYAEGKVTTYKTDIDQYYVIVELMKKYKTQPENLSSIYLYSSVTNEQIPLSAVVKWKETVGPQNVPHYNQINSATISFNVRDGVPLGKATQLLDQAAQDIVPSGITGALMGEAKEFQESMKSLGILMIVAVLAMYLILGILYESYVHPFTILTTLPVAAFGGVATLLIFRSELSLYAYIGMFMLLGIVAKNGIMMIDFANQNLAEGKGALDSIYDACLVRFRPILMTGIAAIAGALPIALGFGADGSSRMPMGLIVAGGLVFSQVITLFVTPGIFLYMQQFQEKYLDRFELTQSKYKREKGKGSLDDK